MMYCVNNFCNCVWRRRPAWEVEFDASIPFLTAQYVEVTLALRNRPCANVAHVVS